MKGDMPINAIIVVVGGMIVLFTVIGIITSKTTGQGGLSPDNKDLPFVKNADVQAVYRACDVWFRSDFVDITLPSQVPEYAQKLSLSSSCVPGSAEDDPSVCLDTCVAVLEIYEECAAQYPPTELCWSSPLRGNLGE